MKNADLKKIRERDKHCWHCGADSDLVPHHRANRGMGGSKSLDNLQNVILICSAYNGEMESNAATATLARDLGHKLSKFMSPTAPLFDIYSSRWYFLDEKGGKTETEAPYYLI